jgi:hypothetical protein
LIPKHREPCILFLEDAFAESHAQRLRDAGYCEVVRFVSHFHNGATKRAEQGVKDPEIIRLCDKERWLLVTIDSSMHLTHTELIKKTNVAILATAHNHADNVSEWVDALIKSKAKIERHFKKFPRPWFATISRTGDITIKTIGADAKCRRNRPEEVGDADVVGV